MRHYKHLSENDRHVIQKNIWNNKSITEIARETGKHKSTISRELKKNISTDGFYRCQDAQLKYNERIKSKKNHTPHKIDAHYDLFLYIIEKLLKKWAPEVIAGRLKLEYPFDCRYHVSHELIYQWIYATSKKHKIKLYTLLPYSKKIRYRRRYKRGRRINIPDRKSIHTRPKEVLSRKTFGHWEADLLVGKNTASYVLNIHERQKRFSVSQKLTDKKTDSVVRAFQNAFGDIPNEMIKTITVDNGIEFFCFKQLEELFECEVYFADPYASYQKGGIEHNNMLLRRRFCKSTDFRNVSEKELQQEVNKRNNIPRKVLNYLTPYETFPTSTVALKT